MQENKAVDEPPDSPESKCSPSVVLNPSSLTCPSQQSESPTVNSAAMVAHDDHPFRSSTHSITMTPVANGFLKDSTTTISEKCKASCYFRLIGINLLTLGVDLCSSAGFTYIPPMMLKAGFSQETMTICMGIGPFLSLILVPLVGHWSDTCRSKWGRRRPFIFVLSILLLLSLLTVPYSKEIAIHILRNFLNVTLILAVGTVILDFTSQALLNPCKALVSDMLLTGNDREVGFTIYSCMLSVGACGGYLLTSINWKSSVFGQWVGNQEKAVFILLFGLFLVFLVFNLCLAKEKPYRKSKFHDASSFSVRNSQVNIKLTKFSEPTANGITKKTQNGSAIISVPSNVVPSDSTKTGSSSKFTSIKSPVISSGLKAMSCPRRVISVCCLPIRLLFQLFRIVCAPWLKLQSFLKMPCVLRKLFVANIMSWMGIMCHNMFYTDFVGQVIYQGKPFMTESSPEMNLYDEGIRMGSWGLLLQAVAAAAYAAFVQERLITKFGQKAVYIFGMLSFTATMIITILSTNMIVVNACTAFSGVGLAAVTTIPYSLVTTYYSSTEIYYPESKLTERGIGEDMAVLDAAYYLSQIIPSMFVGYLVDLYGSASAYMILSAVCGALSCISSLYVIYPSERTARKSES